MNCKQGDLAVVVKSWAGNEGKIVKCVRLATRLELDSIYFEINMGPVWVTDTVLKTHIGSQSVFVLDCQLRPLRDNPGQDETLTWSPVPKKVEA